ncbi:MAG: Omp28-related outer membrane protein [Bacteroidetes bacterium]|nr:Omp28-related outer membrane protein [Bacteroidota bacterium]
MKKFTMTSLMVTAFTIGLFAQATIYTQNFSSTSLPSGWQNVDETGNGAGTWTRKTSAHGFASTSAANGFYIFDSDLLGNDSKPENASLISAAINCSANSHVALQFEHYFQQFQSSSGTVFVSTDNSNWTQIYQANSTSPNPETVTLNLTPYAANQATVYLKFNYSGNYDYWWAIDDIKLFEPAALDIAVTALDVPKYASLSNEFVSGVVTNKGYNTINSFDLTYTVNGGAQVSQSFQGLNIGAFETYSFQFTQPVQMQTPQLYALNVTAIGPNGNTDADPSNNVKDGEINALSAIADKNVLFEEFTTTPCGYCPDGHLVSKDMEDQYSYYIPVNLHAGFGTDGMTNADATAIANAFADGAPTACVDRILYDGQERVAISRNIWEDKVVERHTQLSPATIAATSSYNSNTREVTVNLTAKFFGAITGNFRVNAYLVEDSVTGTGSGYNQTNYYNTTAGHPMNGLGNPIVGYVHRHVVRKALGGSWGSTGVIPATTADQTEYTKTLTYTIPAGNNADRCKIVAFIHEYNASPSTGKNEVLNAVALPLDGSASQNATPAVYSTIAENSSVNKFALYPNPVSNLLNIDLNVNSDTKLSFDVTNILGQQVYSLQPANFENGNTKLQISTANFDNGVYFISVKENGSVLSTSKFVVSK